MLLLDVNLYFILYKLEQGTEGSTLSLIIRTFLQLYTFEYTLRSKDHKDLIGCMYLTFRNRSLIWRSYTIDKCLQDFF